MYFEFSFYVSCRFELKLIQSSKRIFLSTFNDFMLFASYWCFLFLPLLSASEFDVTEIETLFSATVPKPADGGKSRRKSAGSKTDKVHLVIL